MAATIIRALVWIAVLCTPIMAQDKCDGECSINSDFLLQIPQPAVIQFLEVAGESDPDSPTADAALLQKAPTTAELKARLKAAESAREAACGKLSEGFTSSSSSSLSEKCVKALKAEEKLYPTKMDMTGTLKATSSLRESKCGKDGETRSDEDCVKEMKAEDNLYQDLFVTISVIASE